MRIFPSFLLLSFFALTFQNTEAQWVQMPSGTSVDLKDVFFPGPMVGYAVGDSGTVLKTANAGNTWTKVYSNSAINFTSVFFTSIDTGFAAGGKLYKTVDGGVSWTVIHTDPFSTIMEVYFTSSSTGYTGAEQSVYRTTDGGATWTQFIYDFNSFRSIYFPNPQTGYFIGGSDTGNPLYKTTDGGQTKTVITNGFQSIKEAVYFINDTVGYIIGWYAPLLAKTTDGGLTWASDTVNWPEGVDVYFSDLNTGYYIGAGGVSVGIYNTRDGGATWTNQLSLTGAALSKFFFFDPLNAIAVGSNGLIYKTSNGGVGVQEKKRKDPEVKIYPNPSAQSIKVEVPSEIKLKCFQILNLEGKTIKTFSPDLRTLSLSDLPAGQYVLSVISDKKVWTEKIIKQ